MIDLQQFCATVDGWSYRREYLQKPFTVGAFTYASDGAIIVRVPRLPALEALQGQLSIDALKAAMTLDTALAPLAGATFSPISLTLPDAKESVVKAPCDECDGRGHVHDCPSCECVCEGCGGTTEIATVEKISIEALGCLYRLSYLRLVLALPGVELADLTRGPNHPALFRFDGGVAGLCALGRAYARHFPAAEVQR